MSISKNAEIIKGLYVAVNEKNLEYIENLGADNSEWLDVPFNYTSKGPRAIIDPWKSWFDIFPDATCEVQSLVSLGDYVVAQGIGRGTHKGMNPQMGDWEKGDVLIDRRRWNWFDQRC